ncbi:Rossmann-like and DUF2520 domain-containing protein [Clostridioides difficile]|uniref:Rossmann-like and DUF2520 domain-containing protein n=1 Tax=Clostridioides difficile TaxID=1496 RepID=UPI003F8CF2B3
MGFIGSGKVGTSLANYFLSKGYCVSGFYGRNQLSLLESTNLTKTKIYSNLKDIIYENDILFITTSDDSIEIIDKKLSKFNLKHKYICHTSGSLKSSILFCSKKAGALIYSIHPIFAFSNKNTNIKKMKDICFSIEGDNEQDDLAIQNFIDDLGNQFFIRDKDTSSTYHLANVLVSNLVLSLLDIGVSYFIKLGLSEEESLKAISPLVKKNIENIFDNGFTKALTGPVSRGDITPIRKHLSVLDKKDEDIYKILSLNLLKIIALGNDNSLKGIKNITIENAIENLISKSEKYKEIYKLLGGKNDEKYHTDF